MRGLLPWIAFASLVVAGRLLSAAPLDEGSLDAGAVRINWQIYEATDAENPRPLANEFTYLYWLEPTGEGVTLFTFALWNAQIEDPLIVGLPRPITTTGVISGTGPEPWVGSPASWRFYNFFDQGTGTNLSAGERTATMFVHSPSAPGNILTMMHPIPPAICFGCEQINVVPGPLDIPALGDYDGNKIVEFDDYEGWKTHFGEQRAVLQGIRHRFDGNTDGTVNAADYTLWRDHLGDTHDGSILTTVVPEPATAIFAVCALALLGPRRRR